MQPVREDTSGRAESIETRRDKPVAAERNRQIEGRDKTTRRDVILDQDKIAQGHTVTAQSRRNDQGAVVEQGSASCLRGGDARLLHALGCN